MTAKTIGNPFVWYDLMTPDLKAAEKFYGAAVGWKIADSGMPGMSYSILSAGDVMVGGLMQRPKEMGDAAPGWNGHVYVSDVDDYAKRVTKAGGEVHRPPTDIPGIGRFAVVGDPGGAVFILFKPNSEESPAAVPRGTPGHIGWRELHAGDGAKAWDFYSSLFGWSKSQALDMGKMGVYQIFKTGSEDDAGGMMTKMPDTPNPYWLYYFNADAIDAADARVKKAGGKVMMGPHQVPGGQWIIQCADPHGNIFGLVAPKR
jgi:predicted enzyme related to lactoylglutathione lyase